MECTIPIYFVLPENKTKATITDRSTTKMLTRPRARLPIVPATDRQTDTQNPARH